MKKVNKNLVASDHLKINRHFATSFFFVLFFIFYNEKRFLILSILFIDFYQEQDQYLFLRISDINAQKLNRWPERKL